MYQISQVTSDATQSQVLILPDGSQCSITLSYILQQAAWVILSLAWTSVSGSTSFTITNLQITTNPNMLHQWRNLLTFGLGCTCVGNREPSQQLDFSSGNAQLYILTAAEVAQYTQLLSLGEAN